MVPDQEYTWSADGTHTAKLYERPMCSPGCGCRISADSSTTLRSLPICRNACYASPTYWGPTTTTTTTIFAFKYYRFVPLKLRDATTAKSVQIGEIYFSTGGVVMDMADAVATNPQGNNPPDEDPEKAIGGLTDRKWLDRNKGALVVEFPHGVHIDQFSFATANDHPERDPVSWRVDGSQDAATWTTLQTESDFGTSVLRLFRSNWFSLALQSSQ